MSQQVKKLYGDSSGSEDEFNVKDTTHIDLTQQVKETTQVNLTSQEASIPHSVSQECWVLLILVLGVLAHGLCLSVCSFVICIGCPSEVWL